MSEVDVQGLSGDEARQLALRCEANKEWKQAVDYYSHSLEEYSKTRDELKDKVMGALNVSYGFALLQDFRQEQAVKDEEQEDEEEEDEEIAEETNEEDDPSMQMDDEEETDADASEKQVDLENTEDPEEPSEETEEAEQSDDEPSKLQVASEVLKTALLCFSEQDDDDWRSVIMCMKIHHIMTELAVELYDFELAVEHCQKALEYIEKDKAPPLSAWEIMLRLQSAACWLKLKYEGDSNYKEQAITQAVLEMKSACKALENTHLHNVDAIKEELNSLMKQIEGVGENKDEDKKKEICILVAATLMMKTGYDPSKLVVEFADIDPTEPTPEEKKAVTDTVETTFPRASSSTLESPVKVATYSAAGSVGAKDITHLVRRKPSAPAEPSGNAQHSVKNPVMVNPNLMKLKPVGAQVLNSEPNGDASLKRKADVSPEPTPVTNGVKKGKFEETDQ